MFGEVKEEKIWKQMAKEIIYMPDEYEIKKMQRVIWSIKRTG